MGLPDLDLYLASAFERYPAVWGMLAARGATLAAAHAARERIVHRPPGGAHDWSLARTLIRYGAPCERRADRLVWGLALWPEHEFVCVIVPIGEQPTVFHEGIRLRQPTPPVLPPSWGYADVEGAVRRGWHSDDDLEAALGPAPYADGWSPEYVAAFALPERGAVQFTTVHGLVADWEQLAELPRHPEAPASPAPASSEPSARPRWWWQRR